MIKKVLEKKIELTPCEHLKDIEYPIKLEYYITESELNDFDELSGETVYGVEIVKILEGNHTEKKSILNYSFCKESTKQILHKLANNSVTPIGLHFVIDDLIGA